MFSQIRDNVIHIFARFVKDGKATLRFKEPAHDLSISKVHKYLRIVECFNCNRDCQWCKQNAYLCVYKSLKSDIVKYTSMFTHRRKRYIEKNVSLWLLCDVQHSVIMTNFMMPKTHQPIIVIIYSVYFLKDLVELDCRAWARVLLRATPIN